MTLTLQQVRHVAALARLTLTEEEERRFCEQLSAVLGAVEELQGVDTDSVEPTSHASFSEGMLRPDEVQPSLPFEKSLANAPARVDTRFAVPKVLE